MSQDISPGDLLQFRVWCQDSEQGSVNTFHYRVESVLGIVTDEGAAREFDILVHTQYKTIINAIAEYIGVQCRIRNRLPLPIAQSSVAFRGNGTGGAVALPRQTTGITTWRTAYAGPGHRGRTYWPFPGVDADTTDGLPSDAYVTFVDTFAQTLMTYTALTPAGEGTATIGMVLPSKTNPSPFVINAHESHKRWATQRRRGSYGRANLAPIS